MSSPRAIATHDSHLPHGSVVGSSDFSQFSALARMRAIDVLPVAARAAEQIRVGDPAGLDRLLQRLRNVLLPDDFIERSGAISAGENGVRHRLFSKNRCCGRGKVFSSWRDINPSRSVARQACRKAKRNSKRSVARASSPWTGGTPRASVVLDRFKQKRSALLYREKESLARLLVSMEYHRSVRITALHGAGSPCHRSYALRSTEAPAT